MNRSIQRFSMLLSVLSLVFLLCSQAVQAQDEGVVLTGYWTGTVTMITNKCDPNVYLPIQVTEFVYITAIDNESIYFKGLTLNKVGEKTYQTSYIPEKPETFPSNVINGASFATARILSSSHMTLELGYVSENGPFFENCFPFRTIDVNFLSSEMPEAVQGPLKPGLYDIKGSGENCEFTDVRVDLSGSIVAKNIWDTTYYRMNMISVTEYTIGYPSVGYAADDGKEIVGSISAIILNDENFTLKPLNEGCTFTGVYLKSSLVQEAALRESLEDTIVPKSGLWTWNWTDAEIDGSCEYTLPDPFNRFLSVDPFGLQIVDEFGVRVRLDNGYYVSEIGYQVFAVTSPETMIIEGERVDASDPTCFIRLSGTAVWTSES